MRRLIFATIASVLMLALFTSSADAAVRVTRAPGQVAHGDYASVTVVVVPRARCTIGVYYTTGKSVAAGLGPKSGRLISWRWRVGTRTKPGRFPVKIDCGRSGKTQTTIRVV
jgi:hypothetical protein